MGSDIWRLIVFGVLVLLGFKLLEAVMPYVEFFLALVGAWHLFQFYHQDKPH